MNFDKSKVLLKKINAIHDSVAEVGGSFSTLERDLILEYIRNLYECIQHDEEVDKPAAIRNLSTPPSPAPEVKEVSPPPPVPQPIAQPISHAHSIAQPPSTNGHHPTPKAERTSTAVIDMAPEMAELFAESQLTDLSQRFANAPIQDLSKAMGINEKILTINELFKGDQQQFKITADTLNEFTSFAEAKAYLSKGPATKFDWTHNKRKKKAAVFIKLVRRRYM